MMRLGGNFTIMLMVNHGGSLKSLREMVDPVAQSLGLRLHVDGIEGGLHRHVNPDVRITVHGADRAGIVSQVTGALAEAGLNITDLESDVGGSEDKPFYILHVEGQALEGVEALRSALETVAKDDGIQVSISEIDTMIG